MLLVFCLGGFVFLMVGLLLGGAFEGGATAASPETSTSTATSVTTTATDTSGATTVPLVILSTTSTTQPGSATTSIAPGGTPTSTLPDWVLATNLDSDSVGSGHMEIGDRIDVDMWIVPCSTDCDLELIEILGLTAEGYNAVFLPIGGATLGVVDIPFDGNVVEKFSACQGGSGLSLGPYKDIIVNQEGDSVPQRFLCILTAEGNWALLTTTTSFDPTPAFVAGWTASEPGFTQTRLESWFDGS